MLDPEAIRSVCERVLEASSAEACEVQLGGGVDALTRFANNEIHQNMASEGYEISVRSLIGRRTGRASTNRLDAEGIERVVRESELVTRHAPEREDLLPLPQPAPYREIQGAWDEDTAAMAPETRAGFAGEFVRQAREHDFDAAGIVRSVCGRVGEYGEKETIAVANTNGLFAFYKQTSLEVSATVFGPESSGWVHAMSHVAGDLDAASLARIPVEKAIGSRSPRPVPPGEYTVVLEPAAVADLLAFLTGEFGATVVEEGRSFLSGRTGSRLFGTNIRLRDDPYHPLHQGPPFDEEGVPTQPVLLVEDGVQKGLVYDRSQAIRSGTQPTGHGLRVPSGEGSIASHLVLDGGSTRLEDMIAGVERGILVTRFWYTRPVDPRELIITGMTRDGTFLIEDGHVQHGILNMRFNQSLIEMLQQVRALGTPEYAWPVVCPGLLVEGFRFTSTTSF